MKWLVLLVVLPFGTTLAAEPPITAIAFAPDGKEIVAGSQAGLEVRTWPELKRSRSLKTELAHIHDLAFSPDGKALAAVGGTPAKRGTVEVYRWPDLVPDRRFHPHRDLIYSVSWRADPITIATAGADGIIVLRSTEPDTVRLTLQGHSRGVLAAEFLPGEGGLLTAGVDATLRLWDVRTGAPLRTLSNHSHTVHDLALRPGEGKSPPMVASVSDDRTVRLWQPTIGRLVRFARLESPPLAVAWTADGAAVVVVCKDGRVRAIDPDTAEVLDDQPAVEGPAFSLAVAPDGSILVGGHCGRLQRVVLKKSPTPR